MEQTSEIKNIGEMMTEQTKEDTIVQSRKKKKLPKWARAWIRLLIKISAIVIIVILVWNFVGQAFILHDNNMYPHLKDGDLVITYSLKQPIKNDVVLYYSDSKKVLGRIVGCEGDEIDIGADGVLTVNGAIPYENIFYATTTDEYCIAFPYKVPQGSVFVLNDMRENTRDSRISGAISNDEIIGTVVFSLRHREF